MALFSAFRPRLDRTRGTALTQLQGPKMIPSLETTNRHSRCRPRPSTPTATSKHTRHTIARNIGQQRYPGEYRTHLTNAPTILAVLRLPQNAHVVPQSKQLPKLGGAHVDQERGRRSTYNNQSLPSSRRYAFITTTPSAKQQPTIIIPRRQRHKHGRQRSGDQPPAARLVDSYRRNGTTPPGLLPLRRIHETQLQQIPRLGRPYRGQHRE